MGDDERWAIYVCPICKRWTGDTDQIDCDCDVDEWEEIIVARSSQLAGAVDALRKYGGCLEDCSALSGAPECSCGFDEALLRALGRSRGDSDGS